MIDLPGQFRTATREDAAHLAKLVNLAGEGLPFYLWSQMADDNQDPWEIGRQRAMRDEGSFSWCNAVVREADGRIAACLIGYALAREPSGTDYSELPPMFVPLQQLEDMAHGTWYINILATYPEYRGRGIGAELIEIAERISDSENLDGLSLIVSDSNSGARRFYRRLGFIEQAARPAVREDWDNPVENWVLMIKPS